MDNQNPNGRCFRAFLVGTVMGTIAGTVAGLLVSPASGRENREYVSKQARAAGTKGREFAVRTKETVSTDVEKIMKRLRPAIEEASDLSDEEKDEVKAQVAEMIEEETEEPTKKRKRGRRRG